MKKHIEKLELNSCYHIYNKGINGTNIFVEERNYAYFLQKYITYVHPFVDTFAYCLLRNHFHILLRIKDAKAIKQHIPEATGLTNEQFVSKQLSHFFNSYAQGFNKTYERTGALFESPFRRIKIDNISYLKNIVGYIHLNPQLHKMVPDFLHWKHSSYLQFLSPSATRLKKEEVLSWFDGIANFIAFHNQKFDLENKESWIIEDV